MLWNGCYSVAARQTTFHIHIQTNSQFTVTVKPNMHVLELWVEARVPRGNLCRQKETVLTPHKKTPDSLWIKPGPFCCYLLFHRL